MNIVQIINQHHFALKRAIEQSSVQQRKSLVAAIFSFYLKLPYFKETVEKHYQIKLDQQQILVDIAQNKLSDYQAKIQQANALVDEYANDPEHGYEELEALETMSLDGFFMLLSDQHDAQNLIGLFSSIIEVLDYYENFSDDPSYWNGVLAQEIAFQEKMMLEITSEKIFDESTYRERYQEIHFTDL